MNIPRIVLGGTSSHTGKTVISIGLMRALANRGLKVQPYKMGPDFIDPSYHFFATGRYSRNLDGFMMGRDNILESFQRNCKGADVAVIEGAMGLYDSHDAVDETGSTAQASKFLKAPVILIANVERLSRTAAAFVMGYKVFDPDVDLRGVILNRAGSRRHQDKARTAVEVLAKMQVLGVVPRNPDVVIPERHLGLIPAYERDKIDALFDNLAEFVEKNIDVDKLLEIADSAPELEMVPENPLYHPEKKIEVTLGVARDKSFTFYYQDNIDALCSLGAEIKYFDTLEDRKLPEVDALYIGGGFPEIQYEDLEKNHRMRGSVYDFAESGRPVYAECGGLMFLGKSIITKEGGEYDMVDFLPVKTRMMKKFQALGYVENEIIRDNPFGRKGTILRGHEFHHSKAEVLDKVDYAYKVIRGKGIQDRKDGIVKKSTLAGYLHLHVLSYPEWATNFLNAANSNKEREKGNI